MLLLSTLPAFAAVGAVLAGHKLRVDTGTVRLVTARLAVASMPLLALRALLPIPGPFVVSAGMAVGMGSFGVAAVYGVANAAARAGSGALDRPGSGSRRGGRNGPEFEG